MADTFRVKSRKTYDGCVIASYANVKAIVDDGQYYAFVWPNEGEIVNGVFVFNDRHHADGYEPLLVDRWTASTVVAAHAKVNPDTAARIEQIVTRSRGHFARLVDILFNE